MVKKQNTPVKSPVSHNKVYKVYVADRDYTPLIWAVNEQSENIYPLVSDRKHFVRRFHNFNEACRFCDQYTELTKVNHYVYTEGTQGAIYKAIVGKLKR